MLVNSSSSIHILPGFVFVAQVGLGDKPCGSHFHTYGPLDKSHMDLIHLPICVDLISSVVHPFPSGDCFN